MARSVLEQSAESRGIHTLHRLATDMAMMERALLIGSSLWMMGMLVGELLHPHSDLRRAWHAIRHGK